MAIDQIVGIMMLALLFAGLIVVLAKTLGTEWALIIGNVAIAVLVFICIAVLLIV